MADNQQALARLDPQALITTAIDKGAGIETLERLVGLAKDVKAWQAREAWHAAMAAFHRACPRIYKTRTASITGRANYSYSYAPLDEICECISPVLGELGLSISWQSKVEPSRVVVKCIISHVMGHAEDSGEVAMPIQQESGMGANPMQRVGIALTYARRYSLLSIAGLAPEDDNDAGDDKPGAKEDQPSPLMPRSTVAEPPKPSAPPPKQAATRVQEPLESKNRSEEVSTTLPEPIIEPDADLEAEARAREEAEAAVEQPPAPAPPSPPSNGGTYTGAQVYGRLQELAKKRGKQATILLRELTGKTSIPACSDADRAKIMAVK